ncbi:protein of unknown function [Azospirillum baldaniorum]|uniref:Uncharacterized protein n=1 Tax=Azospirillum baldaniorum TaxID=1064539 RepID=A0A9P1JQ56_9PROT|nr:protein of unknown function [Azospirillum baldaniorum]
MAKLPGRGSPAGRRFPLVLDGVSCHVSARLGMPDDRTVAPRPRYTLGVPAQRCRALANEPELLKAATLFRCWGQFVWHVGNGSFQALSA